MSPNKSKDSYPWRAGNRFELLIDGRAYFREMLQAIHHARHSVWLETYLVESGEITTAFIRALQDAAQRGVAVRIMLDGFGSLGLQQADRVALTRTGIRLHLYNPIDYGKLRRNLFRDHRKILVVDQRIAFTGGWGLTDDFSARSARPWRETGLCIEGPNVRDWAHLFATDWERFTSEPLRIRHDDSHRQANQMGRVAVAMRRHRTEIKRHLVRQLRRSRQRIWISTGYFVPSWKLRRALARAARRGIDVRLLLPGPATDHPGVRFAARRHYARLLKAGVRILEFQPRVLHQKVALCDDWVSIGSSNLDRWTFRWNLEANQEIGDIAFATSTAAMFEADFSHSREIHLQDWLRRPRLERLKEYAYGLIDQLSDRYLRP